MACILNLLFLRETRSDILLSRRAARLTKETGVLHVCRGYDTKKTGLRVIAISCLRPMSTSNLSHPVLGLMEGFLVTEPIVSVTRNPSISPSTGCDRFDVLIGRKQEIAITRKPVFFVS